MKKLIAPESNIRYSFRMPNGTWHSFVFYGISENGRLLFINTTYGTKTSMTPKRFSFMFEKYPKTVSDYILENHYPTTKAEKQAEEVARIERERKEKERQEAEQQENFKKAIFKLKTLPINVEYSVNHSLNINVKELAQELESEDNFNTQTCETYLRVVDLLAKTPYALPEF